MDKLPRAVEETIERVCARLGHRPRLARMFRQCYPNTLATTTELLPDGTTYVFTGDIPAMWLRHSTAQVRVYVPLAGGDADVERFLKELRTDYLDILLRSHQPNDRIEPWDSCAAPF